MKCGGKTHRSRLKDILCEHIALVLAVEKKLFRVSVACLEIGTSKVLGGVDGVSGY